MHVCNCRTWFYQKVAVSHRWNSDLCNFLTILPPLWVTHPPPVFVLGFWNVLVEILEQSSMVQQLLSSFTHFWIHINDISRLLSNTSLLSLKILPISLSYSHMKSDIWTLILRSVYALTRKERLIPIQNWSHIDYGCS